MEKNETGYSGKRCGCTQDSLVQNGYPSGTVQLAMVYSPTQHFRGLYSPEDALSHGTLFEELYKPLGKGGSLNG